MFFTLKASYWSRWMDGTTNRSYVISSDLDKIDNGKGTQGGVGSRRH